MKILIRGYNDSNFGDDLMLYLAEKSLTADGYEVTRLDDGKTADVLLTVTGSGFLIHNNKGILYRIREMLHENKIAKRKAVINCNISPFINKAAEKVIKAQIRGYDFISVRDSFSQSYIKKYAPKKICEKYPDMVFALPDEMIPRIPKGNALGIAARGGADCKAAAYAAEEYIRRTGNGVKLLCFDTGAENDLRFAEEIRREISCGNVETVCYNRDFEYMLSQMRQCAVIIGMRFHSIVLALRMGIPVVPVAYSDKTLNALSQIEYDGKIFLSGETDGEELLKAILEAKAYVLPDKIPYLAAQHINKFKEYIKQQA